MSYRGAKVGHAFSSVEQVRLGRVALLQQPLWPHGQGIGLLTNPKIAGSSPAGGAWREQALQVAVHQAYACTTLASMILQVLCECSLSSVLRAMVL